MPIRPENRGRHPEGRQGALFPPPPRRRRRKLMHAADAGNAPGGAMIVRFRCGRCGHDAGWWTVDTLTEAKRGLPCPRCDPEDAR